MKIYNNGNYNYGIDRRSGTKIRFDLLKGFKYKPIFPESIDIKITNYCSNKCEWCAESSSIKGKHADINNILSLFENTIGIEIAIGGGCILDHPDIEKLIDELKINNFPSITINQKDIENSNYTIFETRNELFNKVCGIGVSVYNGYDDNFINYINNLPQLLKDKIVIHTILGLNTYDEINYMITNNINKILILGYKKKGRGESYYLINHTVRFNIDKFKSTILNLIKTKNLILAFDNLAVNQLNLKQIVNHNIWEKYFMGNDGEFSMYVDFVKNEYSLSSYDFENMYKLDNSNKLNELFTNIRKIKR